MSLRIDATGPLMLVQDLGRPGFASLGVPSSGALDRPALVAANRLVGNEPGDAALEILLGGARVTALEPYWVAVTGAGGAATSIGRGGTARQPAPLHTAILLNAGESLELGPPEFGLRYYLAVRGGVDVAPVLGSRSTDVLSWLGPAPVAAGDVLPVGEPRGSVPTGVAEFASTPAAGEVDLRVLPGPRLDWFSPFAWDSLLAQTWVVSHESNRVGLRLDGEPLERWRDAELPGEGMVTGALQVPPSGLPILFLNDHPTTGGYPVIGVVAVDDLALAAQLRPGQPVRFMPRGM